MTDETKTIITGAAANAETGGGNSRARGVVCAAVMSPEELRAAAAEFVAADLSELTRKNYEREGKKFAAYANGVYTADIFAAYCTALAANGARPAALQLAKSAVRFLCRESGRDDCTAGILVQKIMRGHRRLFAQNGGAAAEQHSAPLDVASIARAAENAAAEKNRAIALRDIAMLKISFSAMLRRSEIISLCRGDFVMDNTGAAFLLPRRVKSGDSSERRPLMIGRATAKAIREWMAISAAAGITENAAPLFCRIRKGGEITGAPLSAQGVHRIFHRRTGGKCSTHAGRIGGALHLASANASTSSIARRGGWKTESMVLVYTRKMQAQRCPAAAIMANV